MKVLVIYSIGPGWNKSEIRETRQSNRVLYESLKQEGIETYIEELNNPYLEKILKKYNPEDTIVFNLCETIPGIPYSERLAVEIFEKNGFTYTGNNPDVIELSYDKQKVKQILVMHNITVPYGAILTPADAYEWNLFPAIVKPSFEHCSLTLTEQSVVFDTISLKEQILKVNRELNQPALVEEFIDGREFHVSVWGNNPPEMLPPVEMDFSAFGNPGERLCTYDSKFTPGSTHYEKIQSIVHAPLERKLYNKLRKDVITAWRRLGCVDYARFDFRLRDDKFYFLDINPNNDISLDTSFAMAAEAANFSYGRMLKRILSLAAKRHPVFAENILATA